jgi:hypothetical protein
MAESEAVVREVRGRDATSQQELEAAARRYSTRWHKPVVTLLSI